MTAPQFPMWTMPIPPANPLHFDEAPIVPRSEDAIEDAPQAPAQEPAP